VSFDVSLTDGGAQVEYLDGYITPDEIADQVESATAFTVTCIEPVADGA